MHIRNFLGILVNDNVTHVNHARRITAAIALLASFGYFFV
jgi:hypothetical protein